MKSIVLSTFALFACAAALPAQSEQPQVVGSVVPPVVQPASSQVEGSQAPSPVVVDSSVPVQGSPSSYNAPAGVIHVVGEQSYAAGKPLYASVAEAGYQAVKPVRGYEQYGQPEPASLPANYKPFGSWGLYIGGSPADGYYTDYYKSLGGQNKPAAESAPVKPVSPALASPVLKHSVSGDQYAFAYSPAEFNSHAPVHSYSAAVSPVQAGAQIYGSPAVADPYAVSPYADAYATKKLGSAYEAPKSKEASQPSKGGQSRVYVYPPMGVPSPMVSSQAQVVSYPVPVGSQIVGSQPGVEILYQPYGVHAFTRYAMKPTMMGAVEPSQVAYSGASSPAQVSHAAKPQAASHQPFYGYYPMSFYGYPLNQLHYSQGSIMPSAHSPDVQASPSVQHAKVDGLVAESGETEDKVVSKQQKRA